MSGNEPEHISERAVAYRSCHNGDAVAKQVIAAKRGWPPGNAVPRSMEALPGAPRVEWLRVGVAHDSVRCARDGRERAVPQFIAPLLIVGLVNGSESWRAGSAGCFQDPQWR
jgi:hypothetical protein